MPAIVIHLPDRLELLMLLGFIILPAVVVGGLALVLLLRRRAGPDRAAPALTVREIAQPAFPLDDAKASFRETVIGFLASLHGAELAVVAQAALDRQPDTKFKDDGYAQSRVMLCRVDRARDDEAREKLGQPQVFVLGLADPKKYGPQWDRGGDPFLQHGMCPTCGIMVCSHVKLAICPVCNTSAPLR